MSKSVCVCARARAHVHEREREKRMYNYCFFLWISFGPGDPPCRGPWDRTQARISIAAGVENGGNRDSEREKERENSFRYHPGTTSGPFALLLPRICTVLLTYTLHSFPYMFLVVLLHLRLPSTTGDAVILDLFSITGFPPRGKNGRTL